MTTRRNARPEGIDGRYAPFPHTVLDSTAFQAASYPARALLFDLVRQHTGGNNGHLHLAMGWLQKRGWKSCDVVQRAKTELVRLNLIVETRRGGLGIGPSLYAVTWLPISSFSGLDLQKGEFRRGAYALQNKVAIPGNGASRSGKRSESDPADGVGKVVPVPVNGAKRRLLRVLPVPGDGDIESIAIGRGGSEPAPHRGIAA